MIDIPRVLERMGIKEDMGPTYDTYENFAKNNRFKVAIPTEAEMQAVQDTITAEDAAAEPARLRKQAYRKAITADDFQEAYFEKEFENKPEKMDSLQALRVVIKADIAK